MTSEREFSKIPKWEKDFHRKFNGSCYASEIGLVYAVDQQHKYDWENETEANSYISQEIIDDFLKDFSLFEKTYKVPPEKEERNYDEDIEDIPNTTLYFKAGHLSLSDIEQLMKESLKTGKDLLFEACHDYPLDKYD